MSGPPRLPSLRKCELGLAQPFGLCKEKRPDDSCFIAGFETPGVRRSIRPVLLGGQYAFLNMQGVSYLPLLPKQPASLSFVSFRDTAAWTRTAGMTLGSIMPPSLPPTSPVSWRNVGADLLVLAPSRKSWLERLIFFGTTDAMLSHAEHDVLITPSARRSRALRPAQSHVSSLESEATLDMHPARARGAQAHARGEADA